MKFTNWLYKYLESHRYYMGNFQFWASACVKLWYWLFSGRINHENQIRKLKLQLWRAEKRAAYIKNELVAHRNDGVLSLDETLQLIGALNESAVTNPFGWDNIDYHKEKAKLIKIGGN